ncbi:MAG: glycosyltransferase family 61 protein [Acidimicrobiia bacterium]|nr:glycosyltransferase family 61 protein [Acidimicrobiia bacterium]
MLVWLEVPMRFLLRLWARLATVVVAPLAALPGRLGPPRHVENDPEAFARRTGARLLTRLPGVALSYPVPPEAAEINREYVVQGRFDLGPTYVLDVDGGRVCGADASVIGPDGTFFSGVANRFIRDRTAYPILRNPLLPPVRHVAGTGAVVATAFATYYYHWMTEVLPRFAVLGDLLDDADWVVTPSATSFQRECLARVGVDPKRFITPERRMHVEFDRLLVPSMGGVMNHTRPDSIAYMRSLFGVDGAAGGGRRIYVSRQGEFRRKVVNEAEVLDALQGWGFEAVDPGSMPVADQARLFSEASVVVGPHGGGLTNVMFCAPSTVLVELLSPLGQTLCFWTLANTAQLRYEPLFGRRTPGLAATDRRAVQWQDIDVDCAQLTARLERVLEKTP